MTKINEPIDLAKIIKNTKCVVLKFSASWCGPCQNREFKKRYYNIKDEFSEYSDIKFIEFDVDDDAGIVNDTEYYDFGISSIPHFKICYDGNIVKDFTGGGHLDDIKEIVQAVVKKHNYQPKKSTNESSNQK